MTFGVHVEGGTGAGSKRPKLPANTIPWKCNCREWTGTATRSEILDLPTHVNTYQAKYNPGYLVRCIDCGTQRP